MKSNTKMYNLLEKSERKKEKLPFFWPRNYCRKKNEVPFLQQILSPLKIRKEKKNQGTIFISKAENTLKLTPHFGTKNVMSVTNKLPEIHFGAVPELLILRVKISYLVD